MGWGPRFQNSRVGVGDSGLEELVIHLGAEGPAGSQCPAHKLLGHMTSKGATCFQALGPQGESIYRGRGVEGLCLGPCPSSSVSSVLPWEPGGSCPTPCHLATHPAGRAQWCGWC